MKAFYKLSSMSKRKLRHLTKTLTITILSILASNSFGQRTDSTEAVTGLTQDTFYIIHENIPNSKIWGNCWHFSTAYNLNKSHEFDINVGRTYGSYFCSGGGCWYKTYSWGIGYGLSRGNKQTNNLINAYYEHTFFYFPPISYGLRLEYFYDINNNSNYIRPSAGLSFIALDILYNYSFLLNGNNNLFKHGVTIRYKLFHKQKNWQYNHPNRC
jgi:hypothetical protein